MCCLPPPHLLLHLDQPWTSHLVSRVAVTKAEVTAVLRWTEKETSTSYEETEGEEESTKMAREPKGFEKNGRKNVQEYVQYQMVS